MRVIPKAANDMMDVGRLQGFDVSIALFHSFSFYVVKKNIHKNPLYLIFSSG